jgi:hypothetical protein
VSMRNRKFMMGERKRKNPKWQVYLSSVTRGEFGEFH